MNDLYDQIINDHGKLRDWMDRVPGLRGYMDKGDRRQADRMMREYVANQLQQRITRFAGMEKQILKAGGMSFMSDTRDAKAKVQTYIDKVKAAAPGYSGFFAAIEVDEAAMDRLYAFDEAQVRYVEQLDGLLDALAEAIEKGEGIGPAVQAIYDMAQKAINAFALREDVLTELNKKYS
jgi:hypothetical protein